jgi:ferredoxin
VADIRYRLAPDALEGILDQLAAEGVLVGPVRRGGDVHFLPVANVAELWRGYVNTLVPLKRWFLPTPERLAAYRIRGGRPEPDGDGDAPGGELVFFGVRSCDVAGLAQLTRFFSGETLDRPDLADREFLRRRKRATILSVVCERPAETCLCVCCDGGPALASGFDWQLTRLAAGWLVEVGSERGAALARRFAAQLDPADASAVKEKDARVAAVVDALRRTSRRRVQTMTASRMVSRGRLDERFWDELGQRCVECGGCAYVCPTCSCFNVVDLPQAGAGTLPAAGAAEPAVPGGPTEPGADGRYERLRLRDNCLLAGFVRQAGGAYPRGSCGERCKTRFFHKFSWQFVARVGALGCTGCGRCIQVCVARIGIDVVSRRMTAALVGVPAAGGD